jgi:orotidine-5'-phosphate decarboxylase
MLEELTQYIYLIYFDIKMTDIPNSLPLAYLKFYSQHML